MSQIEGAISDYATTLVMGTTNYDIIWSLYDIRAGVGLNILMLCSLIPNINGGRVVDSALSPLVARFSQIG